MVYLNALANVVSSDLLQVYLTHFANNFVNTIFASSGLMILNADFN